MAAGRRRASNATAEKRQPKELKRKLSGNGTPSKDEKRPRTSQQQQKTERRIRQKIERPGVPAPTRTSAFVVPDRPSPPERGDDKDGHFVYELGDNLTSRYKILSKMGEGTFGRVLECWDRKNKDYVAIKIVRNVQKYRDAAMIELEVLNTLERNDPEGRWHCVSLREWFNYRGHVCMSFEKLGLSLYDFLRRNSYCPFHVNLVRSFGQQLLESVAYLHELRLIHTDLKPENILLASLEAGRASAPADGRGCLPGSSDIKVIDFGSATFDDQYHSSIVSTRHYRAPEVILGLGWSFPCDIWSVGCILVELATGDALFQTHENLEHMAMMEAVLGKFPEHMALAANSAARKYFVTRRDRTELNWPGGAASRRSVRAVAKLLPLKQLMAALGDKSLRAHLDALLDLLVQMLRYDPAERISAEDALRHEFFRMGAAAGAAAANGRSRLLAICAPKQAAAAAAALEPAAATAAPTGSGTAEAAVYLGGSVGGKGGSSQMTEGASQPEGAAKSGAARPDAGDDAQAHPPHQEGHQQRQQKGLEQEQPEPLDGAEERLAAAVGDPDAAEEAAAAEGNG